ncbi:hypothetical protein LX32DRAFT_258255 [Colletotrichum zoysiae]|uniref:Uncharacterized protein n=1 Tax=Colletotrichum zoysiae TaxID=1216348 RepID=A0AAD9H4N9_9PEZI|nr:hypothetical protein LX32DRAFT_258255 [Colletotrichum zoysiae]
MKKAFYGAAIFLEGVFSFRFRPWNHFLLSLCGAQDTYSFTQLSTPHTFFSFFIIYCWFFLRPVCFFRISPSSSFYPHSHGGEGMKKEWRKKTGMGFMSRGVYSMPPSKRTAGGEGG